MKLPEEVDIPNLCGATQSARLALRRPREERLDLVRQYVGNHWSDEGSKLPVPCNLVALYCSIVGRRLMANNPRVMLSTDSQDAKPVVAAMEKWANDEIENIELYNTLQRVVLDGLFSIGICKVGLAAPADAASLNWNLGAGQPFAQRVDLDDFVFDIHARDFSEASFIGHRYRVPLRTVQDSKLYSKAREELTASDDPQFNLEGDTRVSFLQRSTFDSTEFEEMVDLWEIYLPRHKLIITLADDQLVGSYVPGMDQSKPLRVQEWIGPDHGPYHILAFGTVPGSALPKAPLQDLIDLHLSINRILRKLIRQCDRYKQNTWIQGGATEDGNRVQETNDGDIVRVDQPDKIKNTETGIPSQQLYQMFAALQQLFSWLSGNLEIMGGLGPQSKTAHQDAMLNENSSVTISDMQERTVRMTSSVVRALCWYWHHNPSKVMKATYQVPSVPDMSYQRFVYPAAQAAPGRMARSMAWEDLRVRVDPFSLQHQTPQTRLQALTQLVTQIITPMLPLLQQQGIAFDVNSFLNLWAKYMDSPDVKELMTLQEPPEVEEGGGAPESPRMPVETTRNYNRRSEGGATTFGASLERANAMRTANSSPQMNGVH